MSSENQIVGTSAIAGGAQGAAIGAKMGGGWGALIGGIVGTGVGLVGGTYQAKSSSYSKKAQAIQREREANEVEARYLQMIRQGRIARSSSLAASTSAGLSTSSLSTSALSSIGSQLGYNIQYLANDRRLQDLYNYYMRKAERASNKFKLIDTIATGGGVLGSGLSSYYSKDTPKEEYKGVGTETDSSTAWTDYAYDLGYSMGGSY